MTEKPKRSRDAFIALHIDDYFEEVRDIRHESAEVTERLRNLFLEITLHIVTTGRPLSADDRIAAVSVMRSISTYRAQLRRLVAAGLVYQAECGGWLTRLAEAEFSRRAARQKSGADGRGKPVDENGGEACERPATGPSEARDGPVNSKNAQDFNAGRHPPPSPYPKESNNYHSTPGLRAREGEGLREVSTAMMQLLAEHVGSEDAFKLQQEFEGWRGYGSAKDKDAVFRKFLEKRSIHITSRALHCARVARVQ